MTYVIQGIPNLTTSSHVEKTNFCWGDFENTEPLGTHSDINSASSWYDEGDAHLDYILKTVSKTS